MNLNLYPYLPHHITLRKYQEINLFDLKNDESYLIDEEAFAILKKIEGKKLFRKYWMNIFPKKEKKFKMHSRIS